MERLARLLSTRFQTRLMFFKGYAPTTSTAAFARRLPEWTRDLIRQLVSGTQVMVFVAPNLTNLALPAIVILRRIRVLNTRYVVYLGGLPTEKGTSAKSILLESALRVGLLNADAIWYNDDPILERFSKAYRPGATFLPNSVDVEIFKPDESERNKTRTELGMSDSFCVGIVGPFDGMYNGPGLAFLQREASKLPTNMKFLAVGNLDRPYEGSDYRFIFVGKTSLPDYVNMLRAMDCLVVPRFVRTLCPQNKVLEAMSVGVPVIQSVKATPPTGSRLGDNLYVVRPEEMIDIVQKLIRDTTNRQRIGKNARDLIIKRYSLSKVKEIMIESIAQIVAEQWTS